MIENRVPTGSHRVLNIFLKLNLVKLDSKPFGFL